MTRRSEDKQDVNDGPDDGDHAIDRIRGMIRVETRGPVAVVTLDRPAKLNAMSREFWADLREALSDLEATGSIGAIVLTGTGTRAFSVGGDIASFAALASEAERRTFQIDAMRTFHAVETSSIPIVAAVRGMALGGGCEIAMACDIVVAATDAVFGMPEARFGLVPGYGALRAPSIVGASMTKLMIYAGERLSAKDALRVGIVQKICEASALMDEAMRIAEAIAAAPATAIAAGRALIDAPRDPAAFERSIETIARLHGTPESKAAVAAFLAQHRTPAQRPETETVAS